jgi:hypothetical protein
LTNILPPWIDESGALANRLLIFSWSHIDEARTDLLEKMKDPTELTATVLAMLTATQDFRKHVKTTPAQDWQWQYFTNSWASETLRKQPLVKFITKAGTFNYGKEEITVGYELDATTAITAVQTAFDNYQKRHNEDQVTIKHNQWREQLKMASAVLPAGQKLVLKDKRRVYKCTVCQANVNAFVTGVSACKQACSNQCPAKCNEAPLKNQYLKGFCRNPRCYETSEIIPEPYIQNLRITRRAEQGPMDGFVTGNNGLFGEFDSPI